MNDVYIVSYRTGGSCHNFIMTLILSLCTDTDYRVLFEYDKATAHSMFFVYANNYLRLGEENNPQKLLEIFNDTALLCDNISNVNIIGDAPLIIPLIYNSDVTQKLYNFWHGKPVDIKHIIITSDGTQSEEYEIHANHFFKNGRYYEPNIYPLEVYWNSYFNCFKKGTILRKINNLLELTNEESYILIDDATKAHSSIPFVLDVPHNDNATCYYIKYRDIMRNRAAVLDTLEQATGKQSTRSVRNMYEFYIQLQRIFRKKYYPQHMQLP